MITKEIPELLSYETFCRIAVEKRGGFSIRYKKVEKTTSEVMIYRDEVKKPGYFHKGLHFATCSPQLIIFSHPAALAASAC